MEFVKLSYNLNSYNYEESTSITMDIIGFFLKSNVRCGSFSFKQWALNDSQEPACGNTIYLEKKTEMFF